jgi:ABC-type sugar transport system ATPase subunit
MTAEPGAEVIRIEGVSKKSGPVTALADVNLHVRRGEILGLIGTTAPASPR